MDQLSSARDQEAQFHNRCIAVGRGHAPGTAMDYREANVFMIAAAVLSSRFPIESGRLRAAADQYFKATGTGMAVSEALERGWVLGLPRTRDMLTARLRDHSFMNLHPDAAKQGPADI